MKWGCERGILGSISAFSLLFLRADGCLQGMLGNIQVTGCVRAGGCLMGGRQWGVFEQPRRGYFAGKVQMQRVAT